jgi:hypothetical protein
MIKTRIVLTLICMGATLYSYAEEPPFPEYTLKKAAIPFLNLVVGMNEEEVEQEIETVNCIVHIQKGDVIPLSFDLSGEVLSFKEKPGNGEILALKSFFVKIKNGEFSFSHDKEAWKSFEKFFGGKLYVGLHLDDAKELIGTISLEQHFK